MQVNNFKPSYDGPPPDVVVVGGGPIGLCMVVQTRFLTKKNVLVIEKYSEYKRADIRLNINSFSFRSIPNCPELKELTRKWGNKAVPIKEIEDELTKCAHKVGVTILKNKTAEPKKLEAEFPTAKVFIGADGARSALRHEIFGDQYKFNTPLQYLVQVQYKIKALENKSSFRYLIDNYKKQVFAGHVITQIFVMKKMGNLR